MERNIWKIYNAANEKADLNFCKNQVLHLRFVSQHSTRRFPAVFTSSSDK